MSEELFGIKVGDVRRFFPDKPGAKCGLAHPTAAIIGVSLHHDAVDMPVGDQDYNGTSLDEDLERLKAIYVYNLERLGGFPYQLVASPNGRLFWCRDLNTWGAHTGGLNDRLLGICAMGNYVDRDPENPLLCALSLGLIAIWRWCGGLRVVGGHNWWWQQQKVPQTTKCPGERLAAKIPTILDFARVNVAMGR